MASFLEQVVATVADAARWKHPSADAAGAYNFFLQDNVDFSLISPDGGSTVVLYSTVQTLPDDKLEQEALLFAQAKRSTMACRTRQSTLALEDDSLILQQLVHGKTTPLDAVPKLLEDFLNDLAWWRAQAARLGN